jgi:chloramphenicol 3-O-phosphotransferase
VVTDGSTGLDGSCVIVTGAPAAGKSTVSRLVAQRLRRSALLNGDFVNELVVSGRVWALGEPADEAARQVRLCNENLCALAVNFADSGFTPVIDSLIPDRGQLDFFLHALSPRPVLLIVLAPGVAVCRHRNAVREQEEQFFFDDYETLTTGMRNAFGTVGWWFDTSALTPDETATRIIADGRTLAPVGRPGG